MGRNASDKRAEEATQLTAIRSRRRRRNAQRQWRATQVYALVSDVCVVPTTRGRLSGGDPWGAKAYVASERRRTGELEAEGRQIPR